MAFTCITANFNNRIRIVKLPIEIACIQTRRIYSRCRSGSQVTLRLQFPWDNLQSGALPPRAIISCRVQEVQVKNCRLVPLQTRHMVMVEAYYMVKVEVTYRDSAGSIRVAALQEELCRRSRPMPGTAAMSGAAEVTLEPIHCYLDRRSITAL